MKGIEFNQAEIKFLLALLEQAMVQAKEDVDDDFLIEKDRHLRGLHAILQMMKKLSPSSTEIPDMEKAFKLVLDKEKEDYNHWRKSTAKDIVSIQAKLEIQRLELEGKR